MTNQEKLEALKTYLKENNYRFFANCNSKTCGVVMDVFIPSLLIVVRISSGNKEEDESYYEAITKNHRFLVFIREHEDVDFVIEKIKNTIEREKARKEARLKRRMINMERKAERRRLYEERVKKCQEKRARREARIKELAELKKRKMKPKRKRLRIHTPTHAEKINISVYGNLL